ARQYADHADLLRSSGRALDGAPAALAALAGRPAFVQTVLTGNFRAVALTKLRAFGLDGYLDLDAGAYGEDANERVELVSIAQTRASDRYRAPFTATNTVIIGDTRQ